MIYIKTKFYSLLNKICIVIKRSITYQTKYGIKVLNPFFPTVNSTESIKYIDPANLYLGVDFLKDKYTNLNTNLLNSPHFKLMLCLRNNESYFSTEYVNRMLLGCLDERPPIISYYNNHSYFEECYKKSLNEIVTSSYSPITVFKVRDNYYIHDGKHHAAVAAMLGKQVKCLELNSIDVYNSFCGKAIEIASTSKNYDKHLRFLCEMKRQSYD